MKTSSYKKLASFLITVILLGAAVTAALQAQLIRDGIGYYQYTPTETIASFVEQTGMSSYGKFLFYTSSPSVDDAAVFNKECSREEPTTAILGCYNGQKIYIYDITDQRLNGIRQTTAAHEMLHAAYQRLSSSEKQSVDRLLSSEYDKLKNDKDLEARMAFYAVAQPGDRDNELHSIIGTEVETVSAELEQYYSKYFSDRTRVVALYKQYHKIFEELSTRAEQLNNQILQLETSLDQKRATYDAETSALQGDITLFNQHARDGYFKNQSSFNSERQALVARSAALENSRSDINDTITQYNTLVSELNSIAAQTNSLNRSIDSSLEPAPTL